MSESMVTRVAIAVSNAVREGSGLQPKPVPLEGTTAKAIARAAIAAMREPTDAMMDTVAPEKSETGIFYAEAPLREHRATLTKEWHRMVDAALKE